MIGCCYIEGRKFVTITPRSFLTYICFVYFTFWSSVILNQKFCFKLRHSIIVHFMDFYHIHFNIDSIWLGVIGFRINLNFASIRLFETNLYTGSWNYYHGYFFLEMLWYYTVQLAHARMLFEIVSICEIAPKMSRRKT